MASRAGSTGNLPWVRGTSRPGVKKAPRGAQHKEAIKQERREGKEQLSSKKALNILRAHGHKSKVKGDKIKTAYQEGKGGKFKTKIETLPKEPSLARVKNFLGYKSGGLIKGKPKLATRGWK